MMKKVRKPKIRAVASQHANRNDEDQAAVLLCDGQSSDTHSAFHCQMPSYLQAYVPSTFVNPLSSPKVRRHPGLRAADSLQRSRAKPTPARQETQNGGGSPCLSQSRLLITVQGSRGVEVVFPTKERDYIIVTGPGPSGNSLLRGSDTTCHAHREGLVWLPSRPAVETHTATRAQGAQTDSSF